MTTAVRRHSPDRTGPRRGGRPGEGALPPARRPRATTGTNERRTRGTMNAKTYTVRESEIERRWFVVDATDETLGRLASRIARVLEGKHKPTYQPNLDSGDHVIVLNAAQDRGHQRQARVEALHPPQRLPAGLQAGDPRPPPRAPPGGGHPPGGQGHAAAQPARRPAAAQAEGLRRARTIRIRPSGLSRSPDEEHHDMSTPPSTPGPVVARRPSPASGCCRARARSSSTVAALDEHFGNAVNEADVRMPFRVTGTEGRFNAMIKVEGGGVTGQAGAIRHGIARALLEVDSGGQPPAAPPGRPPHPRSAHEGAQEVRPQASPQGAAVHQALARRRPAAAMACVAPLRSLAHGPRSALAHVARRAPSPGRPAHLAQCRHHGGSRHSRPIGPRNVRGTDRGTVAARARPASASPICRPTRSAGLRRGDAAQGGVPGDAPARDAAARRADAGDALPEARACARGSPSRPAWPSSAGTRST